MTITRLNNLMGDLSDPYKARGSSNSRAIRSSISASPPSCMLRNPQTQLAHIQIWGLAQVTGGHIFNIERLKQWFLVEQYIHLLCNGLHIYSAEPEEH